MRKLMIASAMMLALAACGGGDKADTKADAKTDTTASTTVTAPEADTPAETVSAYVDSCTSLGGDAATCKCTDKVFKAELSDDLYKVMVASASGDQDAATAAVMAYLGDNPDAAATMGEEMQAVSEKVQAQCAG